ncbi:MAG: alpha/beta fold hydrolase, partial [Gallionella sp.]|nr:alpha/beta fold hydrolase [Gallionella sp.]
MHIEVSGRGAPLVLLHGWGMHGGVWGDAVQRLEADFQVHTVDLPGCGGAPALATTNLDTLVRALSEHFSEPVHLCGWSLGGQVALHWALREPAKINKLIVVASTPCFSAREDWPCGMPREVLEKFAAELEQDHAATLRRFIALQLRGSEHERGLLSTLRAKLFSRGEPDKEALRAGL